MRKILFWILIIIFLFLVVVLWVAFYQEKTPLRVLQSRFWITDTVIVQEVVTWDAEWDLVILTGTQNTWDSTTTTGNGTTWTITVDTSALSEEDKKSTEKILNGLIVR